MDFRKQKFLCVYLRRFVAHQKCSSGQEGQMARLRDAPVHKQSVRGVGQGEVLLQKSHHTCRLQRR